MNKEINKVFLIHFGIVLGYALITRIFSGMLIIPWLGDIYFSMAAMIHILTVVVYIGIGKESEVPIWLHVLMIMISVMFWICVFFFLLCSGFVFSSW
jgi:hypothetical protein